MCFRRKCVDYAFWPVYNVAHQRWVDTIAKSRIELGQDWFKTGTIGLQDDAYATRKGPFDYF